ncbi:MAG: peptide chain release factor aRF-1 [Candidatus Thermoplasmatota archaeon]|nr:peptide chain release factor aRF-1 [Candidatus Thermoplasmatota archaeon]
MSKKDEYEFKKAVEEIEDLEGRGTELISLYVPPDKAISDVSSYINEEMSESSNIKSKSTRKNVQSALKSIKSKLKYIKEVPENGVIFFVGQVSGEGDKTDMVSKTVEPPEKLQTFTYRCDSEFYVEPLKEMVGERENYGLLVIDRSEATIGILRGNRVETLNHIQSMVPSKHSKGGQSAQRFERSIEKAAHSYFKKVGEKANGLLLEEDIDGLLVGGPGRTKDNFIEGDHLHHELKKKIVDTFNTGYTDEYGLKELMEKAQETLSDLEVMKEKKLVDRLMEEIKDPKGGLAVYGEEETLRALRMGAVDTLLISDGIDKQRVNFDCDNCGDQGTKTIDTGFGDDENICPECGSELDAVEKEDIIDFFFDEAEKVGTDVEMISDQSEEGELLLNAFGGVAGILRFRIN